MSDMNIKEPMVAGVRFADAGKIYHFDAGEIVDLEIGDAVIVETSRGWQLGRVAQILPKASLPTDGGRKKVDRKATPRDLLLRQNWQSKEAEVLKECRTRALELSLNGIKIVSAEYSFDGSRLTLMFSSENEEKVELKSLRQDMQKRYPAAQLEIRQIGPRDVAKAMCGMGACGKEMRCCSQFLTDFCSISIRMAKEQGISLTPTEITGMCGRLRCCLEYEYQQYAELRQDLPKKNKRVKTPVGEGKVVDVLTLQELVVVEIPEVGQRTFKKDEITVL